MQDKTRKLIRYWQEINRFSPVTVSRFKYYNENRDGAHKLDTKNFISLLLDTRSTSNFKKLIDQVGEESTIEVVVGQIGHKQLYDLVDAEIKDPEHKFKPVDGDCGKSFVFYLQLDAKGYAQSGTLMVSEFLRGVCSLAFSDVPSAEAIAEDLDEGVLPYNKPITPEHLDKILDHILSELKIADSRDKLCLSKAGKSAWQILLRLLSPSDSKSEAILQMDFYSDDLKMLEQADLDGHFLEDFILSRPLGTRTKIDTSPEELTKLTLPQHHSAGKWPSQHNPALMQKVAINIATGQNPPAVFSVNGPPGTGKTTLLKEIVANAVVEKARILERMIGGERGLQLKKIETTTTKDETRYYYQLPDALKSRSIIVASNNNAAVENITRDLPLADDVRKEDTCTGLFDTTLCPEVYFTRKAFDLFNAPDEGASQEEAGLDDPTRSGSEPDDAEKEIEVFGLVSAPYGKTKNIRRLISILPEPETEFDDFDWGLTSKPNLDKALKDFTKASNDFEDIKEWITKRVDRYRTVKQELDKPRPEQDDSELESLQKLKDHYFHKLHEVNTEIGALKMKLQSLAASRSVQDKAASLISKIKSIFAADSGKTSATDEQIAQLREKISDLGWQHKSIEAQLEKFNEQLSFHKSTDKLQRELKDLEMQLESRGVTLIEDDKFNQENITAEKAQMLCPWVSKEFNEANERLFYAALQLTKAYICNTEGIFENLKHFVTLRSPNADHGYTAEERVSVTKEAFHTLNLLIPVLSTTFASVQRAFSDFGKGELGTVIIDESGQATPYSALGLLYRSRRCIVVGDPLQVEPIFGTPQSLIRMAYNQMGLTEGEQTKFQVADRSLSYADAAVSVQVMADACNPYYGAIGKTEVGCPLVVHRRCLSPMFDISNEISYDQRMIKASRPKEGVRFALKTNEWRDVVGAERGNKDHYVPVQGDEVVELIRQAQKDMGDPMLVFEPGKLYVISPFKTVAQGVQDAVEEAFGLKRKWGEQTETVENAGLNKKAVRKWIDTSIGTVHTFQGKEAECVILVLGADKDAEGAAKWAALQANILNVAVTRAKYRLVIIGDKSLWGKLDYFKVACEKLTESEQAA